MARRSKGLSAVRQYRLLLGKDLRQEFRTLDLLSSMLIYAVLVIIVYGASLATGAADADIAPLSGGLLWALIVFTSLLGLNRSFAHEREQGALEGILLAPLDRGAVYLAKATSNLLFMLVTEVIAVPLYFFFMASGVTASTAGWLALVLLVGTVGMAGIGTMLATITAHTRGRDVLLAVLFIPLIFPLLYACASATTAAIVGGAFWMDTYSLGLMLAGAYDAIMLAVCWWLYDFVIGA